MMDKIRAAGIKNNKASSTGPMISVNKKPCSEMSKALMIYISFYYLGITKDTLSGL